MKACRLYKHLFKKYIAEEISPVDEGKLLEHIKDCENCREIYRIHQTFSDPQLHLSMPNSNQFDKMREKVIHKIRLNTSPVSRPWYQFISDHFMSPFYRPAVATALFLIVFFLGFFSQRVLIENQVQSKANLLKNIKQIAMNNTDLKAIENSPYIFSNVQFRDMDEHNITLSFDVSTHVELISSKSDPLVKEVLVQSLLNPEPLGTRLKTVSLTKEIIDPKIKQVLIFTLHNDQSLAVRMRALNCLMDYRDDKEIQDAFLKLLRNEKSVNMRLMAIDYLVQTNINDRALENTIPYLESSKDAAVRHKIDQYINMEHIIK